MQTHTHAHTRTHVHGTFPPQGMHMYSHPHRDQVTGLQGRGQEASAGRAPACPWPAASFGLHEWRLRSACTWRGQSREQKQRAAGTRSSLKGRRPAREVPAPAFRKGGLCWRLPRAPLTGPASPGVPESVSGVAVPARGELSRQSRGACAQAEAGLGALGAPPSAASRLPLPPPQKGVAARILAEP